ncbi:hypothetical protein ACFL47_00200 [Candidatus Latescibacterota bacterium]
MAQTSDNNLSLIKFLCGSYKKKGLNVYCDFLAEVPMIPDTWKGMRPDLLVTYRDHTSAICVETEDSLDDYRTISKWKSMLKNSNIRLKIIVRDAEESKFAQKLVKENKLKIEVQRVKKTPAEKRKVRVRSRNRRSRRIDWVIVLTSLMILSVSLLLFGPTVFKLFQVQDYYRPFDSERQIDQLQRKLDTGAR